jgi:hypothetical protein
MIETTSSSPHQSKDDEVEPRRSKMRKLTKIFGLDFLTYLLENEP